MMNEKIKKQFHQPWFGGGIGAVLAVGVGVCLLLLPFGKGLKDWSYDLPFLIHPEKQIDDVVIVYLDEKSYAELGQDPCAFDRSLHAKLLNRLNAEGAKLAVFDVLFIDPTRPVTLAEHKFAEAMTNYNRVVLGAQYHHDEHLKVKTSMVWAPIELLRDAAAGGWGMALIHRDNDFGARQHHPGIDRYPSMAWRAAEFIGAEVTKHPASRGAERWLNYYAPKPFQGISYSDAIAGKPFPFRDKFVFIGSGEVAGYTGEEKEQFRYPWTGLNGHFPLGVEIHALTFSNLVRQDWLSRLPPLVEILVIALAGALLGYGLSLFRPLAATSIALLAALVCAGLAIFVSARLNVWFPWMIVVAAQVPLALGWSYLFHSLRTYMETKLLETSLALYLSPQQVKRILKQPGLLKPGADKKIVSILFSDITNFSKISERMDPDDLVKLLNNYYETAIACVHETDGTVMNLTGDAILAIWNAPEEQTDHRERACRAGLLLNERLVQFDAARRSLPLRTRVGLHTGTACVGNIGSPMHFDYAAIGESVNMASRLEGLNKQLATNILATRAIQKSVEGRLVGRLVGHFRFKGFDQVVEVHELIGTLETEAGTRPWREAFAGALHQFQRKLFAQAAAEFRRTLELHPEDGPSSFYLKRIEELDGRPLPSDWVAEIDLREK